MTNLDPTAPHKTPLADKPDVPDDKPFSSADIEKRLLAQITNDKAVVDQQTAIKSEADKRIKAAKARIAENERWLKAAKPRTYNRKPK